MCQALQLNASKIESFALFLWSTVCGSNSYLDKLVQSSYTLSTQNQATGIALGLPSNACHFDRWTDNVNHEQLPR